MSADGALLTAAQVQECLELLRSFVIDVCDITMAETTDWVAEFQTGIGEIQNQTTAR